MEQRKSLRNRVPRGGGSRRQLHVELCSSRKPALPRSDEVARPSGVSSLGGLGQEYGRYEKQPIADARAEA